MGDEKEQQDTNKKYFLLSIIASLIASLATIYLIQPIMNILWIVSLRIGTQALEGFTNKLYENAALGERDWLVALFSIILFIGPTIFIPYTILLHTFFRKFIFRGISENGDKDSIKIMKSRVIKIIVVLYLVGTYFGFKAAAAVYYDIQLNTSFKQRLAVLSPQITDVEEKELKANWAKMKSRKDYERINKIMGSLAATHNTELPEPLLK